ncbi:hypothetical protein LEP1GSC168_3595 [Leptospira santarosai str. HAI134]|nr:hypothetical protein LEP1GSC168_3595 [Leptospira santarosai str. HAI134]
MLLNCVTPSWFNSFQSSLLSFDFPITELSFSVMGEITTKKV